MEVLPLHEDVQTYVRERRLERKFAKQIRFLRLDIRHPSLHVELLEPKHFRIFSFRVDRKYRAIFIFRDRFTVEILDVNDHYK